MGRSTQSETQEYWKNIWEKKFLHNTNTKSLVDLRAQTTATSQNKNQSTSQSGRQMKTQFDTQITLESVS